MVRLGATNSPASEVRLAIALEASGQWTKRGSGNASDPSGNGPFFLGAKKRKLPFLAWQTSSHYLTGTHFAGAYQGHPSSNVTPHPGKISTQAKQKTCKKSGSDLFVSRSTVWHEEGGCAEGRQVCEGYTSNMQAAPKTH